MVEKDKVFGRLAARETASIVGMGAETTAGRDLEKAMLRVIADLNIPIMQAKVALAKLVKHLQECDLTINFEVHKFFNSKPKGVGYVSQLEGGNAWGGSGYITARDQAEEAMFDYSGSKAHAGVPQEVSDRIKGMGKLSEPTFEASSRPKYAALNYACMLYGSAGQWGRSHMVLREHVKHNATYVHSDSFDMTGSDFQRAEAASKVATFINMHRVISNMPPRMLRAAWDAANGKRLGTAIQVPGLGGTAYVEGQVHGEIRFDRDIARIVISISELNNAYSATQLLKAAGDPFKVRSPGELEKVFRKFGAKNGIEIVKA